MAKALILVWLLGMIAGITALLYTKRKFKRHKELQKEERLKAFNELLEMTKNLKGVVGN